MGFEDFLEVDEGGGGVEGGEAELGGYAGAADAVPYLLAVLEGGACGGVADVWMGLSAMSTFDCVLEVHAHCTSPP